MIVELTRMGVEPSPATSSGGDGLHPVLFDGSDLSPSFPIGLVEK